MSIKSGVLRCKGSGAKGKVFFSNRRCSEEKVTNNEEPAEEEKMVVAKLRFALAVVAVALTAAVLIVTYGRQHLLARPAVLDQKKWSAIMGTNSVFLPKLKKHDGLSAAIATLKAEGLTSRTTKLTAAKFQELAEIPDCCKPTEVPVEDVYEEYNMCQSCLQECPAFKRRKLPGWQSPLKTPSTKSWCPCTVHRRRRILPRSMSGGVDAYSTGP